ncbi:MAG: Hpt domain-containing protein [Vicinamibacterales bacterium]
MAADAFDPVAVVTLFGEADGCELLRLAAADIRDRLDTLGASLAGGDRPAAARAAHSIAGVAGNIMAFELSAVAREMEDALRASGPVPEVLVECLGTEVGAVLDAIGRHARLSSSFLSHSGITHG